MADSQDRGLIITADMWFSVSTKSILLSRTRAVSNRDHHSYGREMSEKCRDRYTNNNATYIDVFRSIGDDYKIPCSVDVNTTDTYPNGSLRNSANFLANASDVYHTLNNVLDTQEVKTRTPALSTECAAIGNTCNLTFSRGAREPITSFDCAPALNDFKGVLTTQPWQLTLLDRANSNPAFAINFTSVTNPFSFVVAGVLDSLNSIDYGIARSTAGDTVRTDYGLAFVIYCTATVSEVSYASINGSITSFTVNETKLREYGNAISGAFDLGFGSSQLIAGAKLAVLSDSPEAFAARFSTVFSQVGMALGSGIFMPARNEYEQVSEAFLVSRVLESAYGCLLAGDVLYMLVAVALLIVALIAKSRAGVADRQARMSTDGLVVQGFEQTWRGHPVEKVKELFAERHDADGAGVGKASIGRSSASGYEYVVD